VINNFKPDDVSAIRDQYREAFEALNKNHKAPEIDVRFYPYIGINHTIRVREGKVFVRIAEVCRDMPPLGQQALAANACQKMQGMYIQAS
jgi:hypothetical protein